jgi:N-acetyl-anhydromuramyl-L-alanine amidase AmpD
MPGAIWRPVPNCTKGGQDSVVGVVLHIMEGTLIGSDAWFRNPASQASAHFGVSKAGVIYQWVDTKDRAWAQSGGNHTWLSIEHEGHEGDALTPPQLAATARIVAWTHAEHGVPLVISNSTGTRGIGWHGMGGAAWGGHYDCPGEPIKAQRTAIIAAAGGHPVTATPSRATVTLGGLQYGYGTSGDHIAAVTAALTKHGHAVSGRLWTDNVTRAYAAYQVSLGYRGDAADGVPGPESLTKLLGKLPAKPKPPATKKTIVVWAGATMSAIALLAGVTLPQLTAANKTTVPDPNHIKPGQTVIIPSNGHTFAPPTTAATPKPPAKPPVKPPTKPAPPKPTTPTVDLSQLVAAAMRDPKAAQGHQTYPAGVKIVEAGLYHEGLLNKKYAFDGSYGTTALSGYSELQHRYGYSGAAADGIPGLKTLKRLGAKYHFNVTP